MTLPSSISCAVAAFTPATMTPSTQTGCLRILPVVVLAAVLSSAIAPLATGESLVVTDVTQQQTSVQDDDATADDREFDKHYATWLAGEMNEQDEIAFAQFALDQFGDLSKPWNEQWTSIIDRAMELPDLNLYRSTIYGDTIEAVLKRQADLNTLWDPDWGLRIEDACLRCMATDEQLFTYVRQAVDSSIEIILPDRFKEVQARMAIMSIACLNPRTSLRFEEFLRRLGEHSASIRLRISWTDLILDGERRRIGKNSGGLSFFEPHSRQSLPVRTLAEGEHVLSIDAQVSILQYQSDNEEPRVADTWTTTVTKTFWFAADDETLVDPYSDPEEAEEVAAGMRIMLHRRYGNRAESEFIHQRMRNDFGPGHQRLDAAARFKLPPADEKDSHWRQLEIDTNDLRTQLSHQIYLERGEQSLNVGTLIRTSTSFPSRATTIFLDEDSWAGQVRHADLVLRYDPTLVQDLGLGWYLEDEIRIKNVDLGGPPDDLVLTPERVGMIEGSLSARIRSIEESNGNLRIRYMIDSEAIPLDWIFDLWIDIDGTEYYVSPCSLGHVGADGEWMTFKRSFGSIVRVPGLAITELPDSVTFILRPAYNYDLDYEYRLPPTDLASHKSD